MGDVNLSFLNKVPDQCGYIAIVDGAIVKSEGDLSNREIVADTVEKLMAISRDGVLPNTKFFQTTVHFGTHFFTITQSGKYTYVVKRRVPSQ